ncbi:hypothetical protein HZ326_0948 [Fusarium oxysporum f. sp. albedinis]|nr:hypothetical protein HZ326_0948 [Fusarium oxysporum f. sp. albedinis]
MFCHLSVVDAVWSCPSVVGCKFKSFLFKYSCTHQVRPLRRHHCHTQAYDDLQISTLSSSSILASLVTNDTLHSIPRST